jgi:lysophospholipase L1-like esterase
VLVVLLWGILPAVGQVPAKEELYEGEEYRKAFSNPVDDPALPRVLLIGDSISIGYTVAVRKLLAGKANVHRIPTNGRYASHGAEHLDKWLGEGNWDVVHFNWGLWDLCYRHPESKTQGNRDKERGTLTATPEAYRQSLEQCVARLKKTGAVLIWCETTPVPKGEAGRVEEDALRYNAVARKVMEANGIAINPLHGHALKRLPGIASKPGDVHFTREGYDYLAEQVARVIGEALAEKGAAR